jgi:hypothetical protein
MKHVIIQLLITASLTIGGGADTNVQNNVRFDTTKTLSRAILEHGDSYLPEGLRYQRTVRRQFQRRGYTNALYDVIAQDPLGSLLSFIKMKLWLMYSTPFRVYWIIPPDEEKRLPGYPFPDDTSYPLNPWKDSYAGPQ